MKNISIGIDDFKETNKHYYVDKTFIIKDIIDNLIGQSILVTRPRRFGKSLMISMLDYYFSNEFQSYDLFKDKKIYSLGEKYTQEMNQYPLIHLNFKDLIELDGNTFSNCIIDMISKIYKKFSYILDSDKIEDIDKENFKNILYKKSNNVYDYTYSIYDLSSILNAYYNKKVIILLDEYDAPVENSYQNDSYNDIMPFLRKFYSSFLKGNTNLYFSFVTGVLEIAKESIFSDLNNLNVFSVVDDDFTEYFGFTENEVCNMFNNYNVLYDKEKIKKWYGGYGNERIEIYNPWSIFNFISKEKYSTYWVNTASNNMISKLISNYDDSLEFLNEIVNYSEKRIKFNNAISYNDLKNNSEALISYLVQSGYLVAVSIDDSFNYIIKIPNIEIEETFKTEIIGRNIKKDTIEIAEKIKDAMKTGDQIKISNIFEQYILNSFSYFDLNNEKEYQVMLVGIFTVLFSDYIVKSETINRYGRCDIMIIPKKTQDNGYIIEVKKHKGKISKSKLENSSKLALKQIKEKEYYNELKLHNIKNILIYGFSFDDKNINVSYEKIINV